MHVVTEQPGLAQIGGMTAPAKPLRVLQVALGYFPYAGGLETHVYEVSRRLASAGVDVTVLTVDTDGALPDRETIDGVQVRRVRGWPANREICLAPDLYREIQRGSWDVIHCQGIHTLVPPLAMLAALHAKIPYVVTFHSGGHRSRLRNAIRGTQWTALGPLLRRAARLIAVSRFEARLFQRSLHLPARRFAMIQNGSQLLQPGMPVPTRSEDAGTCIVSVGRLERYKGHQRIIAALPQILQQRPDARLLILGSGPYEAELRRLAHERNVADQVEIRMIPPGDRMEMATTLANASVMTLLSEYEAHPIAVMEALTLGCPVLVSNTSGFTELAEAGLVRAIPLESDDTAVAVAVLQQLENPLLPAAIELPTWEGCVAQLIQVYSEVAQKTRRLS